MIELSFLKQAMERLVFSDKWVALITNCATIPTFSVIINGIAKGLNQPGRGLRQGFPYPSTCSLYVQMSRGVFNSFVAGRKATPDSLVEIF